MSNVSKMNRRSAMVLFAGAFLAGVSTASAGGGGNSTPIRPGIFLGHWNDGTKLKHQVTFGNGYIQMTRVYRGTLVGTPTYFRSVGVNVFRHVKSGATITIESRRRFVWRNRYNQNAVTFKWKK